MKLTKPSGMPGGFVVLYTMVFFTFAESSNYGMVIKS